MVIDNLNHNVNNTSKINTIYGTNTDNDKTIQFDNTLMTSGYIYTWYTSIMRYPLILKLKVSSKLSKLIIPNPVLRISQN